MAPRLRYLKRLDDEHPELAALVIEHVRESRKIGRVRGRLAQAPPEAKRRMLLRVRPKVARIVEVENNILEYRSRLMSESRDDMIDAQVNRLIGDERPSPGEPPEMLELVREIHTASGEDRDALVEQLRGMVETQFDGELTDIQRQLDRYRDNPEAVVDQRIRQLFGRGRPDEQPRNERP
jgi:hypothetical protein